MRALKYSLDEAVLSLWRGRRAGILSTATIAVALFVLGGFLLATSNHSPKQCSILSVMMHYEKSLAAPLGQWLSASL